MFTQLLFATLKTARKTGSAPHTHRVSGKSRVLFFFFFKTPAGVESFIKSLISSRNVQIQ